MKRTFKVEKLPLEVLLNLLIELYEKGIDYVDLAANNDDPGQDKLIIMTKDSYINPEFTKDGLRSFDPSDEDDDDDDDDESLDRPPLPKRPPTIETRLTDDDINNLI